MADKQIVELPALNEVTDETLIPVYQPGQADPAQRMSGKQFGDFAREAAGENVQRAVDAAEAAEKAADRSEAAKESIVVDEGKLAQAVESTQKSAAAAADSENAASGGAALSKSWAVGGTGVRDGEDTNNSKYWAGVAQAEAERATVPAVAGVYNFILQDRATGQRYALLVENGLICVLEVRNDLEATEMQLVDTATGATYVLGVDGGNLYIEEAT